MTPADTPPSHWARTLIRYREPDPARSVFELAVTLIPFLALWVLAALLMQVSPWLATAVALFNALFLVRLFMIQHDCGHGAFFRDRKVADWVGRGLGVLTLTPYDVWRRTHAIHHASTGNLDRRGVGDLPTLTVTEYRGKSRTGRFLYRLVRNPLFLFGVVPFYTFFLQNRLPIGVMRDGALYWWSALGTNAAILALVAGLYWIGGAAMLLHVFFPTMMLAASIGMWLFYIQHQFEHTSWEREEDWVLQDAAIRGSSYYALPPVLRWFSANIGVHHVHHLASRIPFYRLGEVLRDHEALARCQRITIRDSLHCARLHLWDENAKRLLSFRQARALPA